MGLLALGCAMPVCVLIRCYLLHLCPDEQVQLPAETQHLQANLLWTQVDGHQRSLHL